MKKLTFSLTVPATVKVWWLVLRYRNIYVRLSVSCLFRIRIDDTYLLIKNTRAPYYQPVGGAFKRCQTSNSFFRKIRALSDNRTPLHQTRDNDLRIRIPGRHIMRFIRWFASRKERETSARREFYEELIEPGYLPRSLFSSICCRHIRRHTHAVQHSAQAQSPEVLIADIYELLPTNEQTAFLRQRRHEHHDQYIWVSEETIRQCGFVGREEYRSGISLHAQWIL